MHQLCRKLAEGLNHIAATFKGYEPAGNGTLAAKQAGGPGKVTEWVNKHHTESSKIIDDKIKSVEGSLAKGTGNIKYKEGYYVEHLTGEVEKCTKRHGVSGGHNYDEFKKYFDNSNNINWRKSRELSTQILKGYMI